MAFNHSLTRVLVALSLLFSVLANPTYDVHSGTNYNVAVNVPQNGTDDLYFHFNATSQMAWAAFGFGNGMAGALMFVVYPSSNGQNVTVSPRTAGGNSPPKQLASVQVHVLNGTGIQNGFFIVNAHCTGCRNWSGGSIDITSQSQSMIWAMGPQTTSQSTIQSDSLSQSIQQHGDSSYGIFSLNLQKATGEAGVPDLQSNTQPAGTQPSAGDGDNGDGGEGTQHDYTIVIHAILMIACFLFILPAGYLFLRVFEKVPLHAGAQSLGVVFLIGGLATGIVCNVQHNLAFTYHQVLGIITSVFIFVAFTLGLVSHRYFKKHKVSSPLMKFHRMAGPGAIVLGWGTTISGFVFAGRKMYVLPYIVVLLAVVIFVGGITFLMQKRKVRSEAMKTPAAQNFHAGYFTQSQAPAPSGYSQGQNETVPMQTFSRPFQQQPQQQAFPYPVPGQQMPYAMKKGPDVNIRPLRV